MPNKKTSDKKETKAKSKIPVGAARHQSTKDIVLPPEEMPQKLIQYFTPSKASLAWKPAVAATVAAKSAQQEWLHKIFAILRTHTGHNFSVYKVNTMLRRISRRMGLHQIDGHETYVRYLRENPGEVEALFRELLIGVTNFFRDRESFDVLKTDILPGLFEPMPEDATFRAWIPGCSTGEEVYSLAMILRECLDKIPKQVTRRKVGVKANSDVHFIDMHVCPQQSPKEIVGRLLVVFEDIGVTPIASDAKQGSRDDSQPETSRIAELERELQNTRESHQTTIEELESSNEELKSANEELESSGKQKFHIHGRIIKKDKDFPYRVLLQFVKQGRKANRAGVPEHFR